MDPIFHLLLTNLYAKDARWRDEALLFSVLPDVGFLLIEMYLFFYLTARVDYSDAIAGLPPEFLVVYRTLHSLLVFGVVAAIVWKFRPRLLPAMSAWLLHIVVDIPVHEGSFGTRVLYPLLPDAHLHGVSWGTPVVMASAYAVLLVLYALAAWRARLKHRSGDGWNADWIDRLDARADALLKAKGIPIFNARRQDNRSAGGRLPDENG